MAHGILVATLTPFTETGIDWPAFERLVEYQLVGGVHGLVVAGTTGEAPTLTTQEHKELITRCVSIVKGRVPVIAGTGSNNTQRAVELAQQAEQAGADAVLIINPYYNKPTQDGLYSHYRTIHDATQIPIIIYNSPSRCAGEISINTIARLAELPRIIGIKETSDITRYTEIRRAVGIEFMQFTGNDPELLSTLALGAVGCISVTANIAPKLCVDIYDAWQRGDHGRAQLLHDQLCALHHAMFYESNPIPVKYAASRLGLCHNILRLPLTPLSDDAQQRVNLVLKQVLGHGVQ